MARLRLWLRNSPEMPMHIWLFYRLQQRTIAPGPSSAEWTHNKVYKMNLYRIFSTMTGRSNQNEYRKGIGGDTLMVPEALHRTRCGGFFWDTARDDKQPGALSFLESVAAGRFFDSLNGKAVFPVVGGRKIDGRS